VGPLPEKPISMKELMLLDLSYNRIQGPFPVSIKSLSSLQAFILKGNPMGSSMIPGDGFDGMKALMIVVLSNMNLHGPVPESLGKLQNLRVLHLDGNHFNGPIPKSFGDLKNLSELRLNDNGLSGLVPFGREMVWRMRRKLRLNNNSGLCYGARSGLGDTMDSTFDLGIPSCDTYPPTIPSLRTHQHLSSLTQNSIPFPTHLTSHALKPLTSSFPLPTFLLFNLFFLSLIN